jgi:hypothetical protein
MLTGSPFRQATTWQATALLKAKLAAASAATHMASPVLPFLTTTEHISVTYYTFT